MHKLAHVQVQKPVSTDHLIIKDQGCFRVVVVVVVVVKRVVAVVRNEKARGLSTYSESYSCACRQEQLMSFDVMKNGFKKEDNL